MILDKLPLFRSHLAGPGAIPYFVRTQKTSSLFLTNVRCAFWSMADADDKCQ